MAFPRLVSGIQPSGKLHVGNYLGVLKNLHTLAQSHSYDCYFFLADLHSLTEPYSPEEKKQQILQLAADFFAADLDPQTCTIFQQSTVESHTVLSWILTTITPMGELRRMTQFKDKSTGADDDSVITNVGLFTYPVLMAADILLYDADVVPVGDDQLQHLELTRAIARKFNGRFGDVLREPRPLLTNTPRVMSLRDPQKKMSKSSPAGCLFVDDEPDVISQKIQAAVTDSGTGIAYDPLTKPAISNLIDITCGLTEETPTALVNRCAGMSYSQFKTVISQDIVDALTPHRTRKKALLDDPDQIISWVAAGSERAEEVAAAKLDVVRRVLGIALEF
ncbi:MAG: tryptophanyl-tRNA synthetase, tryptophanyl-tRNA synthetase [Candidatus Parcubacteria bacterium]